jgi:hypothetical protein
MFHIIALYSMKRTITMFQLKRTKKDFICNIVIVSKKENGSKSLELKASAVRHFFISVWHYSIMHIWFPNIIADI